MTSAEERRSLAAMLNGGVDFNALTAWAEFKIAKLREQLEGDMPEENTAKLRGQIEGLKELRKLEQWCEVELSATK